MVGRGQAPVGLTDSDDIAAGQSEGLPVAALPMSGETLLIPNTVAVIRDGPNPGPAEHLFSYLHRREVIESLVAVHALEGASVNDVAVPTLKVDWDALLRDLQPATDQLNRIFLR